MNYVYLLNNALRLKARRRLAISMASQLPGCLRIQRFMHAGLGHRFVRITIRRVKPDTEALGSRAPWRKGASGREAGFKPIRMTSRRPLGQGVGCSPRGRDKQNAETMTMAVHAHAHVSDQVLQGSEGRVVDIRFYQFFDGSLDQAGRIAQGMRGGREHGHPIRRLASSGVGEPNTRYKESLPPPSSFMPLLIIRVSIQALTQCVRLIFTVPLVREEAMIRINVHLRGPVHDDLKCL